MKQHSKRTMGIWVATVVCIVSVIVILWVVGKWT